MGTSTTQSVAGYGRVLALFVLSVTGLIVTLGIGEPPLGPAAGPLAILLDVTFLAIVGILLYNVGRIVGALIGEAEGG